jgi:alginate O-acetyltransferase complex protein AlgI
LERHIAPVLGSKLRFDGFLPSVGIPSMVFVTLLFGFVLVWGFPNLQRLLERYRSAELSFTRVRNRILPRRVDATLLAASLSALLFFVVVLAIGSAGPSEFLYFEF